ncbi:hypothetical protein HD554DRAFT_2036078 [Boletus coccyginus]|nr:hypothetical protein HD554DRAFT_2036078 [Boletus coccyginus]
MSTVSDNSDPETTNSQASVTFESFQYTVTHVFLPIWPPNHSDYTLDNDLSLARGVCAAAHAYGAHVYGVSEKAQWRRITKMLDNLQASAQSKRLDKDQVTSQLRGMETGDTLVFFIRYEDAAIIFTKRENFTLCESFEVVPRHGVERKSLIYSYPCSAIETPNEVFDDEGFQSELTNFLSRSDSVYSYLSPPPAHPQCLTALPGILQGVFLSADAPRITKHVRDYVGKLEANEKGDPWRRSPLWLVTRVAIQMSVDRSPLGRAAYKRFLLFFICTLSRDRNNADLSSDLLHLMSCKVLRRLGKLGSSAPHWLSEMALKTCACLGEILDARWKQLNARRSPFRNPSQDELTRDTRLSLLNSHEYIRNALSNPAHESVSTPFHPNHRRRGTIEDFLSSNGSFFEEEWRVNPVVALYDVEQSVEQGIDDWLACVTNVNEACTQVGILLDKYLARAFWSDHIVQDGLSIELLTMIELYVAIDKLVVKEIPMLAEYSPEIPIVSLEGLLLRNATSLHRLSCAYLYLSMRHSQARPGWSVLSAKFTEDSFPVRYYDQSLHLQQLKVSIEEDAMKNATGGDGLVVGTEVFRSPLPSMPLQAKAVVFELQTPPCVRIWRSVTTTALACFHCFDDRTGVGDEETPILIADVPELQPYFVGCQGPPLSAKFQMAYFCPEKSPGSQDSPILDYMFKIGFDDPYPSAAGPRHHHSYLDLQHQNLRGYESTSHTSNDVLAAQANCPTDFAPDEFITFAHLRSGSGSLQWLNILRGLRSRTLNLRHHYVHHLLTNATFQVGPLDLNTGTWIWHQELQDSYFCNGLLDELDSLFMEVAVRSIDGVMMKNISLLLTRMLASSPSEDVSERAFGLLRSIRRKTFNWVQELLYDLVNAPTNKERTNLLLNMAVTCRSTFDIGPASPPKLVYSAEDVDALLSCAILIHALREFISDEYSQLLLGRDRRLSLALEEILRDEVLADPSDYGVDLAVARIFVGYKPCACRWEQLQYPTAHWLVCKTAATMDYPSKSVHINLLNGEFQVDGQPWGTLPRKIRNSPTYRRVFRDQGFFVIPSNLPGMDFTTLSMASEHKEYKHRYEAGDEVSFKDEDDVELVESGKDQYRDLLLTTPSINSVQSTLVPRLSVAIPRCGLSFFVNEREELESRDFKDMVYDEDQSIGVLFGLENLLVLRPKTHIAGSLVPESLLPRRVLIPRGHPTWIRDHRVCIHAFDPQDVFDEPLYFTYDVDTELGCLIGSGSLKSMRYLAYLHATTSCHRPDPLTGKTGAQAGLDILKSAGCQSITGMLFKSLDDINRRNNSTPWSSTRYPQINIAHYEIQKRYYWPRWEPGNIREDESAVGRGAYLFPWNTTVPTPPEDRDPTCSLESDSEPEGNVSTAAPATVPGTLSRRAPSLRYTSYERMQWLITLDQLLLSRPVPDLPRRRTPLLTSHKTSPGDIPELNQLFSHFRISRSDPPFKERYITLLETSADSWSGRKGSYRYTSEALCAVQRQLRGSSETSQGKTGSND